MRKSLLTSLLVAGLAIASMGVMAAPALKVGDKAPAIKVANWIKGKPVKEFAKGKVYVMEFWATWCGPCKTSIPHLTEMAKKYKGKCTFTGVSVFERGKDYMSAVNTFVENMGDKMDYNVAVDGTDGWMGKNWMEAAEQPGIPTAFIIGKDTKIAWIGHPMDGMDQVVGEVIADKFDPKAEAARQAKKQAEQEKMQAAFGKINQLVQAGKHKEAVAELDKMMAASPEMETNLAGVKFNLLLMADEEAAYPYAKKLAEGKFKDNAQMLNQLAWTIVDDSNPRLKLKKPDYDVAVSIAERAVEVTKSKEPMILDTLGYAYFKKGNVDKAIAVQEKAVKLIDEMKDVPAETKKEISDRLEMFKKKKNG